MTPRRFLIVCMIYPVEPGRSYMTTELAEALVAAGHQVEVLVLDWDAPAGLRPVRDITDSGVVVVRCSPRWIGWAGGFVRAATKFVLTGRHAARTAEQWLDLPDFDVMIAWMPAVAIAPLVSLAERAGIPNRLLFIWDFFPQHYREIGRIPGGLAYRVAKSWEGRLLARFTAILCTLPGNADYLRTHFAIRADQRILVTPIWSDTTPLPPADRSRSRACHDLPSDRPIAIFGGQITAGRGFDMMLEAADLAAAAGSPLLFLFVGDGRDAAALNARAAERDNVLYRPAMPRADYLGLLGACDVGMVATVPGVTSFATPTKTMDYLRAGLPVIAALEPGNGFSDILLDYDVGRVVAFGDPQGFQAEATWLATDARQREIVRDAAPRCLDAVFDVRHALTAIEAAIAP